MKREIFNGKSEHIDRVYGTLRYFEGENKVYPQGELLFVSTQNNEDYDLVLKADGKTQFITLYEEAISGGGGGGAAGNFAAFDDSGNLTDSGVSPSDYYTKAASAEAIESVQAGISASTPTETQQVMLFSSAGVPVNKVALSPFVTSVVQTYAAGDKVKVVESLPLSPAAGESSMVHRVPGTGSYSDYQWDGTSFVLLATYAGSYLSYDSASDPSSLLL